jgi:pimeloyl-ACP methyl ester carboxylesterase
VLKAFGTLFPTRAAAWFERVLLTPRRAPVLKLARPAVPNSTRRLPYGAGWVSATEWGVDGPRVLLVHGWGGSGDSMAAFVEPLVEAGYRAVTFDLPAHGASDGQRTNLIECAGAVLQVEHAFGRFAGVVMHSFGGPVGALAWRHGLRADALAMLAPPMSVRDVSVPVGDWLGLPRRVSERTVDDFARRLGVNWEDLRTDGMAAEIEAPLLVVHDERDRVVPWSHGAAVARAAPHGQLRTTEGLGHRDLLLDPSVLGEVVAFITRGEGEERRIA